ncbi:MAG TPA: TonB-dependent receptor [Terracidiphilus sp.]|nr:TonB-dependent receptor [Terracidiphilus sp.]
MKRSRLICAAFVLSLLAGTVHAQESVVTGTVTDQSGALVPNATITLINDETGVIRSTVSNGDGLYSFPSLLIGKYTLTVNMNGFAPYKQTGVIVTVGATLRFDVRLAVGTQNQQVIVQADVLQVQTETSENSNLITSAQMKQLATNGRNMVSLTTLGLGVSANIPSFNGVASKGTSFTISFNGNRPSHNVWLVDGAEAYDRGAGGQINLMPNLDAIAEFQTLASNYSPDYGAGSGGMISIALKSGTRDFHGSVWEFNRNDALMANYYFSKRANRPKPELRLNVFGGTIGGPLFIPHFYNTDRRKTFFFFSEEDRRYIQGTSPTQLTTVASSNFPTLNAPLVYTAPAGKPNPIVPQTTDPAKLQIYAASGLVAGQPFPQNTIPAALIDQNAVRFLNTGAIPQPNTTNNQFVTSVKNPVYLQEQIARVDHEINDKLHLMAHFIHDAATVSNAPPLWGNASFPTVGSIDTQPGWNVVVKLTQTIAPALLNETSFNVNGDSNTIRNTGISTQPAGWSATSLFTGNNALNRLPEVQLGSPYNFIYSSSYFPWFNSYVGYQIRDDLSWTVGLHSFKFGAAVMRMDKNQQLQQNTQGTYIFNNSFTGDSYVNLLLGDANTYSQLQALTMDHWNAYTYTGYVNDNWHAFPRLTLNLGVRYDGMPHVAEKNNRIANFIPSEYSQSNAPTFLSDNSMDPNGPGFSQPAGAPAPFYLNGMHLAGVNGFPRGVVEDFLLTIQPRIGFTFDPFGNGRTVVRGAFGTFYERIQGNDVYNAALNAPFAYVPTASNVSFSNPHTNVNSGQSASTSIFPAAMSNIAYYYPHPGVAEFSLGVQNQLARSVIAVLQYVGSTGWHQSDNRAINTLPLNSPNRQAVAAGTLKNVNAARIYPGYAGITQEEVESNTSYNSLQAGLRMENRHGLTAQVSYTWSHEIDIVSDDLTGISNPFNLAYDRGSGTIDRRNILNLNYIYKLPFFQNSGNAFQRATLGGWEISGVTTAESGLPIRLSYSPDVLGLGGGTTNRPNVTGPITKPKTQPAWFNKTSFGAPTAPWNGGGNQGFGNSGKDAVVGPGLFNWNISLFKTFPLSSREGPRFELRAESFNTFNHTQFQNVDTNFTDSNFGTVTSTYDPRVFQLGGEFIF